MYDDFKLKKNPWFIKRNVSGILVKGKNGIVKHLCVISPNKTSKPRHLDEFIMYFIFTMMF